MNYFFKPSFLRSFKKLKSFKQQQAIEAMDALKTVLEAAQPLKGLGLRRLSKNLWEVRSSLKDRILFVFEKDVVTFVLVGSHDDIAKYLKNI